MSVMQDPSEREQFLFRMTLALASSCVATENILLILISKLPDSPDIQEAKKAIEAVSESTTEYLELMRKW